ncbi:MAG TPA: hypothetical protein VEC35_09225 [Noviherbaspirillum sp.]|nr:hypothetical protein [Noviherbaspirillum sp.]
MKLFKIRNFGNDKECDTIEELEQSLQAYRGKSVSILVRPPQRLVYTVFVDVSASGELSESYGQKRTMRLADLLNASAGYKAGRQGPGTAPDLPAAAPTAKGRPRIL